MLMTGSLLHDPLQPFFRPRGIALLGLSRDPTKLGYGLARNLTRSFRGPVWLVHPRGGTWCGRRVLERLDQIDGPVDLAVLLLPAPHVAEALDACGHQGVKAAIVASGGFREVGAEGVARERALDAVRLRHGVRLLGPNGIGVLDTHAPLDTTFLPPLGVLPGAIGLVSHSGAACAAIVDQARHEGWGLSRLISLGNCLDVSEADALLSLAADPNTRAIALYLEGVQDGPAFLAAATQAAARKPVVVLKVGRSEAGRRAAASHTGALAGSDAVFDAALRRAGVLRAATVEQLLDWTRALVLLPAPRGARVAVLTNAGGPAALAVDAAAEAGLELAPLAPYTRKLLAEQLPAAASLANPVDMLASADPETHARCARTLLSDPTVDALLAVCVPPPMFRSSDVAEALLPVARGAHKPAVVAMPGGDLAAGGRHVFEDAGVPVLAFPERAAAVLGALVRRTRLLAPEQAAPLIAGPPPFEIATLRTLAAGLRARADADGLLPADAALELALACGLPCVPSRLALDEQAAVEAASAFGAPVALKAVARGLSHKSDVGGVALDLGDEAAVRRAWHALRAHLGSAGLADAWQGVLVQPMVTGQEVIVGAVRDAQFGPVLLFGSGGQEVEGLGDVALALAPLTHGDVQHLLAHTWAGRRLRGFRQHPPADSQAVTRALALVGELLRQVPELAEFEINPLRVGVEGQGAFGVDVRARLA
jgi:acetyltransferase